MHFYIKPCVLILPFHSLSFLTEWVLSPEQQQNNPQKNLHIPSDKKDEK